MRSLKGYDAGKKVSGIKRHIAVDTQGLPHAVAVSTAEVTDRKGALQALERCKPALTQAGKGGATAWPGFGFFAHEKDRRDDLGDGCGLRESPTMPP